MKHRCRIKPAPDSGLVGLDLYGVQQHRWTSSGGVQIIGHVHPDHLIRVIEAWWTRHVEKLHEAPVIEAQALAAIPGVLALPAPRKALPAPRKKAAG